jgi:tetratricopeptide (TPR) repeat protein
MRKFVLAAWLLLPVGAWAVHEGPGQEWQSLDRIDAILGKAYSLAKDGEHATAITRFEEALKLLPTDRLAEARRIRLELAKSCIEASGLPRAHADLRALVDELDAAARETDAAKQPDPKLHAEARSALANAQYYMTWLLRLEGMPREKWEPEIEASRQNYRLLAERAAAEGRTAEVAGHQADLESAVRLARMELKDLQGLPLPSQ